LYNVTQSHMSFSVLHVGCYFRRSIITDSSSSEWNFSSYIQKCPLLNFFSLK